MHLNPEIALLLSRLANPRLPAIDLSLTRMEALLARLGNPHWRLPPVVHVAGTNGKGSTIAFLRAMWEAAGKRVHVYTSPHLVRFNERIVLSGAEISDEALLPLLKRVEQAASEVPTTFFEATTAAAFLAFAEAPADIVLLETGLGGRLDATNMVPNPALTLITPIGFDHMEFLGDSLPKIASEKAGIMKLGVPCVAAPQAPEVVQVLLEEAAKRGSPIQMEGRDWKVKEVLKSMPRPSLLGEHQHVNAALAVMGAQKLGLPLDFIARGLQTARWPGRLQHLIHGPLVQAWGARGEVYLDGAHNAHGAEALAQWLSESPLPTTLLLGMMQRKDVGAFLTPLLPRVRDILTVTIPQEGAHEAEALCAQVKAMTTTPARAVGAIEAVAAELQAAAPGRLLIAGSLFLAGEILKNHS